MSDQPLLSILIPTVPRRVAGSFQSLVHDLTNQAEPYADVEVIGLFDNRRRILGEKRNVLLQTARGKYLVFIDDDDRVHPKFVKIVRNALLQTPTIDLLVYDVHYETPGAPPFVCHYDLAYRPRRFEGKPPHVYYGPPAHTHVWRTSLVQSISFPDKGYGEDIPWCEAAAAGVKVQVKIDEVLYWYLDNPANSETQTSKR